MAKESPKVWATVMIHKDNLERDPKNTQKQSRKVFAALRNNIKENGFDENLLVCPHPEKTGVYTIYSGNHRFEAGVAEGMVEFPCVVRTDWTPGHAQLQSVRRNYARGQIDHTSFSFLVTQLQNEHGIGLEDIYGGMGFSDVEEFSKMYQKEQEQNEKAARTSNPAAPKVKLMDDLGIVLSHIFEKYGDTVQNSFIIFPAGGKQHVFVQSSNALKKILTEIMAACVDKGYDINTALAGLLQLGAGQTDFLRRTDRNIKAVEAGQELETDPEDTDFEAV